MAQYALDTDTFTLLREGEPVVTTRATGQSPGDVVTTVITVEEQLSGWYTFLRRAKRPDRIELAYAQLIDTVLAFSQLPILRYTQAAIAGYAQLRKLKLNVRAMDLRIAAIALEHGAVMVTRNVRDFARVPGLTVEEI